MFRHAEPARCIIQRCQSRGRSKTLGTGAPHPSPLQGWTFADFSESPHNRTAFGLPLTLVPFCRPFLLPLISAPVPSTTALGVYGSCLCPRQPARSSDIASHGCCGCFLRVARIIASQCSPWNLPLSSSLLAGPSLLSVPAQPQADPAPLPAIPNGKNLGCPSHACP